MEDKNLEKVKCTYCGQTDYKSCMSETEEGQICSSCMDGLSDADFDFIGCDKPGTC